MKNSNSLDLLRKQLDARFVKEREALNRPTKGWIRTIRQALGMSATQLAIRLGVSKQAVANMEHAELQGTLNLTTLCKAAEALDCHLKVVLVPKKPITEMVQDRATETAKQLLKNSSHSMKLEAQETGASFQRDQVRRIAEKLLRSTNKKK